ncbi:hypothetical protein E2C01_041637 [Portunus trituberculatus]|uniref:Uncharacterized protein n=1 Tax=Portunus trituberculatus TaxID=210409 RepID=A0A5B7FQV9_PORTR|nr:hypothetical protein [Portunus trituberculatus]
MQCFTNFRTGTVVLQRALETLITAHHTFNRTLAHAAFHHLNIKADIAEVQSGGPSPQAMPCFTIHYVDAYLPHESKECHATQPLVGMPLSTKLIDRLPMMNGQRIVITSSPAKRLPEVHHSFMELD